MLLDELRKKLLPDAISLLSGITLVAGLFFLSSHSFASPKSKEIHKAAKPDQMTDRERIHTPILDVPRVAENGGLIPISVKINHPMEPGHYIRSIEITDERSPVPSKGVFKLSSHSGRAFLATRIKLPAGTTTVKAIAECNLHGFWEGDAKTLVAVGGCGAQGIAKNSKGLAGNPGQIQEDQKPQIRLPREIEKGKAVQVRVKVKHPMIREGLEDPESKIVIPAHYINKMEVFYGDSRVAEYDISPGLSKNPFIAFFLKPTKSASLKVVFKCNLGNKFENTVKLSVTE